MDKRLLNQVVAGVTNVKGAIIRGCYRRAAINTDLVLERIRSSTSLSPAFMYFLQFSTLQALEHGSVLFAHYYLIIAGSVERVNWKFSTRELFLLLLSSSTSFKLNPPLATMAIPVFRLRLLCHKVNLTTPLTLCLHFT